MTEKPTPYESTSKFEEARAELEKAMAETYVGHPTFMAFSDLVDLEEAEIDLDIAEAANIHYIGNDAKRMQVALVKDRIQSRISTERGYFTSNKQLNHTFDLLMEVPAKYKPFEFARELRDSIAEREI